MSRVLVGCQGASKTAFEVISNPEFMSAGTAITDCLEPERVLIGGRDTPAGRAAVESLARLYRRWVPAERVLHMGLWSSELAKLAANAFLAQRISSINAIAALCEETGADVEQVGHAIGTDSRIGPRFLKAGCGFGGPALQKHVLNLVYICESLGLKQAAAYWQQVVDVNDWVKNRFVRRVISAMFNTIRGKRIAVLGFAYKANTTDTRDTAAIDVCRGLLLDGAKVAVYDPKVEPEQIHLDMSLPRGLLEQAGRQHTAVSLATVDVTRNAYDACRGAHAVCVLTDWPEFRLLNFQAIYSSMMKPAFIFDGRNLLDHAPLRAIGFVVYGQGKPLDAFLTQRLGEDDWRPQSTTAADAAAARDTLADLVLGRDDDAPGPSSSGGAQGSVGSSAAAAVARASAGGAGEAVGGAEAKAAVAAGRGDAASTAAAEDDGTEGRGAG
ncbi:hypothetical protein GPECTOR_13g806 [Gonium pectorale]|uniref:UDP-glucose 6-dehydrogenase n=1 Tax=Gonium pectorale TaxID=33097 RepID=A0A150GNC0_GONPE|nr:hypothetical protein GPECTOR_13g806 [Gonium pectorale]|eukprot:KXZ51319.1 hypothetical protein GPECTOR_13g806 [Gonium pectorale]